MQEYLPQIGTRQVFFFSTDNLQKRNAVLVINSDFHEANGRWKGLKLPPLNWMVLSEARGRCFDDASLEAESYTDAEE